MGRLRLRLAAPRRVEVAAVALRGSVRARVALRIALHDDGGNVGPVGHGEAMPLPGYSRDDADAAAAVLAALAAAAPIEVPDVGAPIDRIAAALRPHAAVLASSISARFALECALVDGLSRRAGLSAAHWLAAGRALQPVPISVLLPEDPAAAVAAAAAAASRGHAVLKIKVARSDRSADAEHRLLAALHAAAPLAQLRLDANGGLDRARLRERFGRWAALGAGVVELVEEPVAGAALLELGALPLRWAADESLADPALAAALLALPDARVPAAFVLKPAQLGLVRCFELARAAAARGIGLIVTHSFDGDLGHAAACALAAAMPLPPWPCGLAPHEGMTRRSPAQPWLVANDASGLGCEPD